MPESIHVEFTDADGVARMLDLQLERDGDEIRGALGVDDDLVELQGWSLTRSEPLPESYGAEMTHFMRLDSVATEGVPAYWITFHLEDDRLFKMTINRSIDKVRGRAVYDYLTNTRELYATRTGQLLSPGASGMGAWSVALTCL